MILRWRPTRHGLGPQLSRVRQLSSHRHASPISHSIDPDPQYWKSPRTEKSQICTVHRFHVFFGHAFSSFSHDIWTHRTQKGYFPHLFNTAQHQNYMGPLPDVSYYMSERMSPKGRATRGFLGLAPRLNRERNMFDFRQELLDYCKSDVQLLKEGCMTFRRDFKAQAAFCPFAGTEDDCLGLQSLSPAPLLQPQTIACECPLGWRGRHVKQSASAFEWLAWEDHLLRGEAAESLSYEDMLDQDAMAVAYPSYQYSWDLPRIRYSHNGGEMKPLTDRQYTCDGYDDKNNTPYEFNGCFWHGVQLVFLKERIALSSVRTHHAKRV